MKGRYRARVQFFYWEGPGGIAEWPLWYTKVRESKYMAYRDASRMVESATKWGLFTHDKDSPMPDGFKTVFPGALHSADIVIEEVTDER